MVKSFGFSVRVCSIMRNQTADNILSQGGRSAPHFLTQTGMLRPLQLNGCLLAFMEEVPKAVFLAPFISLMTMDRTEALNATIAGHCLSCDVAKFKAGIE